MTVFQKQGDNILYFSLLEENILEYFYLLFMFCRRYLLVKYSLSVIIHFPYQTSLFFLYEILH